MIYKNCDSALAKSGKVREEMVMVERTRNFM